MVKNSHDNVGDARDLGLIPGSGSRKWQLKQYPLSLPGKFWGQRTLVDRIQSMGWQKADTTDHTRINRSLNFFSKLKIELKDLGRSHLFSLRSD